MSICVSEADTGSTIDPISPTLRILAADRYKMFSCFRRGKLREPTVAGVGVVAIGGHLAVVVEDLLLQATVGWASSCKSRSIRAWVFCSNCWTFCHLCCSSRGSSSATEIHPVEGDRSKSRLCIPRVAELKAMLNEISFPFLLKPRRALQSEA